MYDGANIYALDTAVNRPTLWNNIESRLDLSLPQWREQLAGFGEDRQARLGTMIRAWMKEKDAGEQRETIEHLIRALDEDRLSDRKLFPKQLKGKSW